jgi:hypothetical protein
MAVERKPPPPGWERHERDPNLVRKVPERTMASDFYPNLKSAVQFRDEEGKREQAWIERRGVSPLGGVAKERKG